MQAGGGTNAHRAIGTRVSSGSKNSDLLHKRRRPASLGWAAQLPAMPAGHWQAASQSAT